MGHAVRSIANLELTAELLDQRIAMQHHSCAHLHSRHACQLKLVTSSDYDLRTVCRPMTESSSGKKADVLC